MPVRSIALYLAPWKLRREREAERVRNLRGRDGDACARCRRPLNFDLPRGHDLGVSVEQIIPGGEDERALHNLRLTHRRCSPGGINHTDEVTERMRRKNEAALFANAKPKRKRKVAA
jgi:5-methylcytosine-specific restriction endonuclease McrA